MHGRFLRGEGDRRGKLTRPAGAADWFRDWLAEAHLIARSAPGLGNPLDLTVTEFDRHLALAATGGEVDERPWHRRYIEEAVR